MVEIIAGEKGKGKTKYLLDKVNDSVKSASGNIVYLDKSQKHMYELNNKVRLINVTDFPVSNCDEFLGFICGIVSQDHDLQQMYFDSFLKIACLEGIAYRQGWINEERMRELAQPMLKNQYGQYLLKVIDELKETGKANLD